MQQSLDLDIRASCRWGCVLIGRGRGQDDAWMLQSWISRWLNFSRQRCASQAQNAKRMRIISRMYNEMSHVWRKWRQMILHAGNHLIWFIAAGTSSKSLVVGSLVRSRAAGVRCSVYLWLDCKCTHVRDVYLTL